MGAERIIYLSTDLIYSWMASFILKLVIILNLVVQVYYSKPVTLTESTSILQIRL